MIIRILFFIIFFLNLSFANDIPRRKLRFFCLDVHGSVSADVKHILEELGHEVVIWMVPGSYASRWTLGHEADPVEIIDYDSWFNINIDTYQQFYERYKEFLDGFDGFISALNCTFAPIYQSFNKPTIIINATRYEGTFSRNPELWSWMNDFLKQGVAANKLFIVANNKGDQHYLKYYTGLDSEWIPSLCLYTQAHYSGNKKRYVCQPGNKTNLYSYLKETFPKLIHNISGSYQWQDIYNYKGIVHLPYQISTMSIFEEYSANVPLFFPTKKFLLKFFRKQNPGILSEISTFRVYQNTAAPTTPGDLNNLADPQVVQFWIDHADFYDPENMPYIQYFDSFEELENLLKKTDPDVISRNMKQYNRKRRAMVYQKWKTLLEKVIAACK